MLLCTFGKIMPATSMHIHRHESRNNKHSFGINYICSNHSQITIGYFQYLSIANQHRAICQPALRSQYMTIYYLSQHTILLLK